MGDMKAPDVLVERLHLLRARHGLSTQQMAAKCGLPKSSMESYLRLSSPKRPGVDALISIAEAMDVSMDWLTGRITDPENHKVFQREYSLGCFNITLELISWLRSAYYRDPQNFISGTKIAGYEDAEVAARCMASFIETIQDNRQTADEFGPPRREYASALEAMLSDKETGN